MRVGRIAVQNNPTGGDPRLAEQAWLREFEYTAPDVAILQCKIATRFRKTSPPRVLILPDVEPRPNLCCRQQAERLLP
jgi:hypothetical protein